MKKRLKYLFFTTSAISMIATSSVFAISCSCSTVNNDNLPSKTSIQAQKAIDDFSKSTQLNKLDITLAPNSSNVDFEQRIESGFDGWLSNHLSSYDLLTTGSRIESSTIVAPTNSGSLTISDATFMIFGKDKKVNPVYNASFILNVTFSSSSAYLQATDAIQTLKDYTDTESTFFFYGDKTDVIGFNQVLAAQIAQWWSIESLKTEFNLLKPTIPLSSISSANGFPSDSTLHAVATASITFQSIDDINISKLATIYVDVQFTPQTPTSESQANEAISKLLADTATHPTTIQENSQLGFQNRLINIFNTWWTANKAKYNLLNQTISPSSFFAFSIKPTVSVEGVTAHFSIIFQDKGTGNQIILKASITINYVYNDGFQESTDLINLFNTVSSQTPLQITASDQTSFNKAVSDTLQALLVKYADQFPLISSFTASVFSDMPTASNPKVLIAMDYTFVITSQADHISLTGDVTVNFTKA